jgi:hypothetical protein
VSGAKKIAPRPFMAVAEDEKGGAAAGCNLCTWPTMTSRRRRRRRRRRRPPTIAAISIDCCNSLDTRRSYWANTSAHYFHYRANIILIIITGGFVAASPHCLPVQLLACTIVNKCLPGWKRWTCRRSHDIYSRCRSNHHHQTSRQ